MRKAKPRKRPKPPQPTILKTGTARRLAYLERHGLADFSSCNLVVAFTHFKDLSGKLHRIKDGSPTHGV
jgi:hypothetical protein